LVWADLQLLALRVVHHLTVPSVVAVVITHGTDTLEEAAFFLSRVLPAGLLAQKTVVLTCAMRPSTSEFPDGPQNLRDAVVVALGSLGDGVLVVCAGVVHSARNVQKAHPYRIDAFISTDSGPLGYLEEGRVRWSVLTRPSGGAAYRSKCFDIAVDQWPRVEMLVNTVGVGGAGVRSICAAPQNGDAAVLGIVVAGTGNGTVNQDMEEALDEATVRGVRVVRTTRCPQGRIVLATNAKHELPVYDGLSLVKARVALVLELLGD